ncbi:hypothetical protein ABKV19_013352 [Rosa sericea]
MTIKVATALLPSSHQVSAISLTHPAISVRRESRTSKSISLAAGFTSKDPARSIAGILGPWVSPVFLLQIESSSNTSKNGVSASPFIKTKGPTSDFNQSRRGRRRIILFVLETGEIEM